MRKGCVVLLCLLTGCFMSPISKEELYGSYLAVSSLGSETLVLRKDGTFLQVLVLASGSVSEKRGKWKFAPAEGISGCTVVLDSTLSFYLLDGVSLAAEGAFGLRPFRSMGKIYIGAGQDNIPCFKPLSGGSR